MTFNFNTLDHTFFMREALKEATEALQAGELPKIGVCIVLLAAAFLAKRSLRFQCYWQILFGLFILTLTVTLDLVFGIFYQVP